MHYLILLYAVYLKFYDFTHMRSNIYAPSVYFADDVDSKGIT